MDYYNQMNKDKLSLLLFEYVIQHTSRLSRIIYKPYGNGLLIGLGGNGRKSLAKLASFINECVIFKIEITKSYGKVEWQDDLKSLYKSLGVDNKRIVFTFADTSIKNEMFIEDINNILNVGEVPNLYTTDEIDEIKYEMGK
jgi:dynein heavy chain